MDRLSRVAPDASSSTPAIECVGLTKRYGAHRGIEGVNLTVQRGEIFGFIGPNGAGKSTTIRCLLGLISITAGEARVLGYDVKRQRTALLEHVGYLPSEVAFYDHMRARDIIRYAASFYHDRAACLEHAQLLAKRLELDLAAKVEDMSLGNRKKVGIVIGLMHNPELIILDEPTSGLDPLMQRTFFDIIREQNKHGATVLFSSHVLSEVQRICNRVAIIREGSIVDVRSVAQLRARAVKRVRVVQADGRERTFLHRGRCNELIASLAQMNLQDVEITEPTLEEAFMHYYERPTPQHNEAARTRQDAPEHHGARHAGAPAERTRRSSVTPAHARKGGER